MIRENFPDLIYNHVQNSSGKNISRSPLIAMLCKRSFKSFGNQITQAQQGAWGRNRQKKIENRIVVHIFRDLRNFIFILVVYIVCTEDGRFFYRKAFAK